MKRIICLLLTVSMLFSFTAFANDGVSEENIVQTIKALGIMRGDQYGNMDLDRDIARAEFVKMMVAASKYKDTISEEGSGFSLFSDVKNNHWASEYIRVAVNEKWVVGYTDGSFKPSKTITLEEACTALLRLLGYSSESLAGSFPYAQLNKADAIGLRDMVNAKKGQELTRRDCMYLFYNLLTAENSGGQVYATTLGYTVTNNKVDYMSVITEGISGPYVANGVPNLPFDTTYATVYRDGKASSVSAISRYDVYYYNTDMKTVWAYTDRVSGVISALSPNATNPTGVTVGGKEYKIETPEAQYKLSALSGAKIGDVTTLLLGMNGTVVSVIDSKETNTVYYGVVQKCVQELDDNNGAAIKTKLTVACTNGNVQTFTLDREVEFTVGKLVSVSVSNGSIKVNSVGDKSLSGVVSSGGTRLGTYAFADNVCIIDVSKEGDFVKIEPERIAGITFTSSAVRYYVLNTKGEISHLILNDITGDTWTYGYMTDVNNTESMSGNVSTTYTYLVKGVPNSLRNSAIKFSATTGGVAIRYDTDGSVKNMKNTSYVKLIDLTANEARSDNKTFKISDDVQVYLKQDDEYYLTDLTSINAEEYDLMGHYDNINAIAGGRIRIIIATAK
ncbi:MAG: S-layer homology domain-containing protein [Clostridia bacterium]|nr:S-layer homology domain-containing protein [Clostridia bacterium]